MYFLKRAERKLYMITSIKRKKTLGLKTNQNNREKVKTCEY